MSETGKTNALVAAETAIPAAIEAALLEGDVQRLKPGERTAYYRAICESVGLNWLTRPLDLIKGMQDGKYRFYFRKEATDQLARASQISFTTLSRERMDDLYIVEMRGTLPNGRSLEDQGIVAYPEDAAPTERANAMMKATTKARRRITLGLVGLGWQVADETQQGAVVDFSLETGALIAEESVAENHTSLLFGDHESADAARRVEPYVPPPQEDRPQAYSTGAPASAKAPTTPPVQSASEPRGVPDMTAKSSPEKHPSQPNVATAANNIVARAAALCGVGVAVFRRQLKLHGIGLEVAKEQGIAAFQAEVSTFAEQWGTLPYVRCLERVTGLADTNSIPLATLRIYGETERPGHWAAMEVVAEETLAEYLSVYERCALPSWCPSASDDTSWMPEAELLAWIDSEAQERHVAPEVLKNLLTEYAEGWEGTLETVLLADIPAWKAWAVNQWTEDALTGGA